MQEDKLIAVQAEGATEAPNTATCAECGWSGPIEGCRTETEGTWEEGYYQVHLCPVCPEGGCIDDYTYVPD